MSGAKSERDSTGDTAPSLVSIVPRERDDLRVEGEGDAERRHEDVAQAEVEQEVVAGGARPPRAQPAHDEEQVQQDGQVQ